MPPVYEQLDYLNRFGDYFENVNQYLTLKGENPSMKPPELPEQPDIETQPTILDLGYAVLAKDSYQPIENRKDFNNYKYLQADSNENIAVYQSDVDNEVVYAIKGTSADEPVKDFFRNTGIAIGGPSTQFFDPTYYSHRSHIKKTHDKYKDYKPVVVGHSQGGTYAHLLGSENPNYKTITYNAGTGFIPSTGDIKCLFGGCDNIKNYRVTGDWASSNSLTNAYLLRPKQADAELIKQGEQAERFFLPSEVFLGHGINQFIGRKPNNLKNDYGVYGRAITKRLGGIAGALTGGFGVTELAKKKLIQTQLPSVAGRVTETGRQTFFSPPRVPPQLVAPTALPSTPIRDEGGRLLSQIGAVSPELLGEAPIMTEPIPRPMVPLGTAVSGIKAVDKIGKFGAFAGAIGGIGVGDVLGSVSYDYLFKPSEEELLPF